MEASKLEAFKRATKLSLQALRWKVHDKSFAKGCGRVRIWGGAGVVIDSRFRRTSKILIYTQHPKELSWLFYELRDIFHWYLDYMNKYQFYGELAASIRQSMVEEGDNPKEVLLNGIAWAEIFLNGIHLKGDCQHD